MATRLTINLPDDVWTRLDAEAASKGQTIGKYLRNLIVSRDTRKHSATRPSTETAPSNSEESQ